MNEVGGSKVEQTLNADLAAIASQVEELAKQHTGDSMAILALLRVLEKLHQEIRDTLFQDSLPDNRQALYRLLRNIESAGGWPYIHRMKLQSLLSRMQPVDASPEVWFEPPPFSDGSAPDAEN